jgi:hypothetical protein
MGLFLCKDSLFFFLYEICLLRRYIIHFLQKTPPLLFLYDKHIPGGCALIGLSIINDEKEKVQKGTLFSSGAVTRDFSCCAHYVDDMIRNWGNWGIGDGPFVSVPIVPVQDKGTDTKGTSPSVLSVTEGGTNGRKNERPVCK